MGTEEPDVNELIVEYLKSKSLFDTARKVKDDLLARSLTTGSTAAIRTSSRRNWNGSLGSLADLGVQQLPHC